MMLKRQNANSPKVRFFPVFLGATLAVMIDMVESLVDETVVGNLFDDVAFGAINLLEPYLLLRDFVSYLICVGGTALIVRARGAQKPEEMRKLYNHCVTCCLIIGLAFCAAYSFFNESLVALVAGGGTAPRIRFRWKRSIGIASLCWSPLCMIFCLLTSCILTVR